MSPQEKLLSRLRLDQLRIKATELGLPVNGTKTQLITEIAKAESERFSRAWKAISGGKYEDELSV